MLFHLSAKRTSLTPQFSILYDLETKFSTQLRNLQRHLPRHCVETRTTRGMEQGRAVLNGAFLFTGVLRKPRMDVRTEVRLSCRTGKKSAV